jgi:hypothetical protein
LFFPGSSQSPVMIPILRANAFRVEPVKGRHIVLWVFGIKKPGSESIAPGTTLEYA